MYIILLSPLGGKGIRVSRVCISVIIIYDQISGGSHGLYLAGLRVVFNQNEKGPLYLENARAQGSLTFVFVPLWGLRTIIS